MKLLLRTIISIALCIALSSCAGRHSPAPVVTLSTELASKQNLTEITSNRYIVKKGDTLFAIAFYSGNSYRDVAKWNNIKAPYQLRIGQELRLSPTSNSVNAPKKPRHLSNKQTKPIDPTSSQAYGGNVEKLQNNRSKTSEKPNEEASTSRWIWPANGTKKVAKIAIDGSNRGLDIAGQHGAPIVAAASGKVVYAGNALKGYGNLVIIKHDDDYLSAYAHNDQILVQEQTFVTQGQQIATMGRTGASMTMLHFEIRKRGRSVDPMQYLPQ